MQGAQFELRNKHFLITGAASGIGRRITEILAEQGNRIIVVDKDESGLKALVQIFPEKVISPVVADVSSENDRLRIIQIIQDPLDGLVNCAGIIKLKPMRFVTEKDIREITINNYEGPVLLTNYIVKKNKLTEGSSIVFISSIMSIISTQTNGIYTGSKAALAGIVKTFALELAKQNIRVNAILPAFVETPMLSSIEQFIDLEKNQKDHPLGLGNVDDIANSIYFLLSNASKWITGTNLIIDGGYYAK